MTVQWPATEVMAPVRKTPTRQFRSRFAVTSLATALDVGALLAVGPAAYECAPISTIVPFAFSILALGALTSLGHMWYLTIQSWNCR
jgi:hypothetical protein